MQEEKSVLRERAGIFAIYLVILFINAFVDLGHKIIISNTIFYTYDEQMQLILTPIVNAMILVPFVLLFTLSGHLSDKFAKPYIMRWSAFAAVLITLSITYCYYHGLYKSAFGFTLILATQSAIYSPAKYGYIRECLKKSGLSIGNAYVQAITLTSILLGTLLFTKLFFDIGFSEEEVQLLEQHLMTPEEILLHIAPLGWVLVGLSLVELLATFGVRFYATQFSKVKLSFQKLITLQYLAGNIRGIKNNQIIWYSILGTAIFWSMSQNLVAVFPAHAKFHYGITDVFTVNAMLALSIIGIMIGAYLSARKSINTVRVKNIYIGSTVITVCAILVPVISSLSFLQNIAIEIAGYITSPALILVSMTILLFGVGAGMMIVPLNALMQGHSAKDGLGGMLAGKNWIQTVAMLGLLALTALLAILNKNSEFILYLNALIALVGFTVVLKRLKALL